MRLRVVLLACPFPPLRLRSKVSRQTSAVSPDGGWPCSTGHSVLDQRSDQNWDCGPKPRGNPPKERTDAPKALLALEQGLILLEIILKCCEFGWPHPIRFFCCRQHFDIFGGPFRWPQQCHQLWQFPWP